MNDLEPQKLDEFRRMFAGAVHAHWKLFLIQGVIMMGIGLLAIALPHLSTLAIEVLIGWLIIMGGVVRTLSVLRARQLPGFWISLITAALAVILGSILVIQPAEGVLTLTMALIVLFIVEGALAILIAVIFQQHQHRWGWPLFSGLVDLFLAYLIWRGWPATAAWAIGLLVGANMFFLGLSLVMIALGARAAGDG